METKGNTARNPLTISVNPHSLDHHLEVDHSFSSEYLRTIAAIASQDGFVSLTEYSAINDIVNNSDESAVATVAVLHALQRPTPLKDALISLKSTSAITDISFRQAAFKAARPLLRLQGFGSREIAKKLADALSIDPVESDFNEFPSEKDQAFLKKMVRSSMRLIKGKELRNLADMCLSVTGDVKVSQDVIDYEDGLISENELRKRLNTACVEVNSQIQSFKEQLQVVEFASNVTTAYLATAQQLRKQVAQRMANVEARLCFERDTFEEDMDALVHDAGNAFEVEVTDRLKTDQWKLARVWESIGKSTFAKVMENRISRVVSRREESLRLIKEDRRLFQEEMRITRTSILSQKHHSQFAKMMPSLRVGTRAVNTVDTAASVTLGTGSAAIAGVGTALYFLGSAVVLPVITPAIPYIAVPMLVAGIFKWFSDAEARKDGEISHKREAFEKVIREQLLQAQSSFNQQLDQIASDFQKSAVQLIQPIMLEAEAADQLANLQVKMAKRLIDQSSMTVATILRATTGNTSNTA